MANLKDIRDQIKSVKSIQKVTKAMKMVAAAKMRRAQENMEQARPYTSKLNKMLNSLIPEIDRNLLPELESREKIDHKLLVVITADRGMAGAFNSNVIKMAQKEIDKFKNSTELFAYPFGQIKTCYNSKTNKIIKKLGAKLTFSSNPLSFNKGDKFFHRMPMDSRFDNNNIFISHLVLLKIKQFFIKS